MVLKLECVIESLFKKNPRLLGPTPRVNDSADLLWDLNICIGDKFSGDVHACCGEDHAFKTVGKINHFKNAH